MPKLHALKEVGVILTAQDVSLVCGSAIVSTGYYTIVVALSHRIKVRASSAGPFTFGSIANCFALKWKRIRLGLKKDNWRLKLEVLRQKSPVRYYPVDSIAEAADYQRMTYRLRIDFCRNCMHSKNSNPIEEEQTNAGKFVVPGYRGVYSF